MQTHLCKPQSVKLLSNKRKILGRSLKTKLKHKRKTFDAETVFMTRSIQEKYPNIKIIKKTYSNNQTKKTSSNTTC